MNDLEQTHPRINPENKQSDAAWEVLVAIKLHGLENPSLLQCGFYRAELMNAHARWAELFLK